MKGTRMCVWVEEVSVEGKDEAEEIHSGQLKQDPKEFVCILRVMGSYWWIWKAESINHCGENWFGPEEALNGEQSVQLTLIWEDCVRLALVLETMEIKSTWY